MSAKTLYQKIWDRHEVVPETVDHPGVLYIDLHLIHEVTSPQAFDALRARGLKVRRPDRTVATMDHATPTLPRLASGERPYATEAARRQVAQLEENCAEFGITLHGWDSPNRGIVHVIGPELGHSQPGRTMVCGDSHTSTHGAFGALAFGIGTTEVGHVLASQCLLQRKAKTMRVHIDGRTAPSVTAKDIILAIIRRLGVDGGTGHVLEYGGEAIRALSMEGRMTLCNMSIEAGARAGLVAPDQTTFDWIKGREAAPQGADWDTAVADWATLTSDTDAAFDTEVTLDGPSISPMLTYGTNPAMGVGVDEPVPEPETASDREALDYMGVAPGRPLLGMPVDVVFVGSCTNARMSDLREAADLLRGRTIAPDVRMLIVPGSGDVKRQAEAEDLHTVFEAAGAEWREPGCSMCIAMNGDQVGNGQLAVSTSNRNFAGRQGTGARTVLASPASAAAAALAGAVADPRTFEPHPASTSQGEAAHVH